MGRWLKDQKERKKQEIRTHNAHLHAAVSVAGVAAAIAAVAASTASPEMPYANQKNPPPASSAIASAAALVASHCIEIAEDMGAEHDQILTVVNSAINAKTNGDIMTLTAGAATALRGAATLKARLQKGPGATSIPLVEEKCDERKEANILTALDYVFRGGELLKRTRKGMFTNMFVIVASLKWKRIKEECQMFKATYIPNASNHAILIVNTRSSSLEASVFQYKFKFADGCPSSLSAQLVRLNYLILPRFHNGGSLVRIEKWNYGNNVVVKMKSKHMAGTFTKKKKYIVTGVCNDIPAWPGREKEDISEKRAYFGIKTTDRTIEFECGSKGDKQFWLEGIQYMLNCRVKVTL
ncbi:VAN3-binding protein isoform D [Glycine soja]|uniref:VAN3-binding protein isoform D n=1 Tax=Glycine soja TaxID=3848 RepID=A0A445KY60_GLYSO|nr:VAN3-binding protein isoform D [Glycine soja]